MSFGRDLQLERERRGITLEAVAEGTKVSSRHLRALEADDAENMPGGVFNRGMVRSYCRFLNLPEEEWLERFSGTDRPAPEPDLAEFAENVKRSRVPGPPNMRGRWLVAALLLVILGGAGYASWKYVIRPRLGAPLSTVPVDSRPTR
ncbi:Helix-turn-helix domain-containing protein [Bryocella elongata]|uniref:Helix-turn-helix domain-containing protein n=1 Tax=Bryocella elongata TaxID=863522 RepID=A0A1H6A9Z4_9BACT|nr:helix-turn-helix domain-containing protein [Bryocella elongata]SEG45563.1 Helix-turn-helix domain-containing protein [Bryocella elongata]